MTNVFQALKKGFCATTMAVVAYGVGAGALAQSDGAVAEAVAEDAVEGQEIAGDDVETAAPDLFARDSYGLIPIVCPFKGQVDYDPETVSCGRLTVPENREKSRSRMIQLHFVKLAAREPDDWDAEENGEWAKRDDPVIYLTGGPGAQAVGYVKRLKDHGIRDARDLFILEQRGIGFSEDFCPLYSTYDPAGGNVDDWIAAQEAGQDRMETCFAKAKQARVDLSGYNTIENARDVKALRRALGFDQWNVWGISYGSILGQAYLREDPDGVRAVVLDAIVPIDPAISFNEIGKFYQRDLDILADACSADAVCGASFPDFGERLKGAIAAVRDKPIEVDAIDAEIFPSGKAWFFADIIGGLPFIMLYEQDNYAALPALIDAIADIVETEDYERFRALTVSVPGGDGFFGISQGMYNAIACNDGWVTQYEESLSRDQRNHPELGAIAGSPAIADNTQNICKRYGMRPRDPAEYAPIVTDIPAVIAEGQMDPITPPPLAEAIMPGFKNGAYVEFPFAGHGPTRSVECAGDFLNAFFDAPDAKVDTSCADEMEAPDFIGPLWRTDGLLRLATEAGEDPKNVAAPAAIGGFAAISLLFAALIYSLAPIARLINGDRAAPTGGARPLAWLVAVLGVAAIAGLGFGVYQSFEASQFVLLAGVVGWTRWFAWIGLAAGFLGGLLLLLTARARLNEPLPIGTLLGLLITGAGGVALAALLLGHGFAPI